MIRFFNGNNPFLIVFLFLYTILFNLVLFIYPASFHIPETHAPLARLVYFITKMLFSNNHIILSLIALVLVFAQALMFNALINDLKIFVKRTYVPAAIYILIACLFKEFLFLTPVLMANTFIILIINKAFSFFRKHQCFSDIFDMGLLISIGSLFYFPTIILIILLFIALGILRPFNWREWTAGFLGFFTPYFLAGTYFFLTNDLLAFFEMHILSGIVSFPKDITPGLAFYIISGVIIILSLISFFTIQMNYLKSPIHVRKFFVLIGWSLLLLALSFLFRYNLSISHFALLSVPLSVMITYFLLQLKRVLFADIIHLVLFAIILFFQYYA